MIEFFSEVDGFDPSIAEAVTKVLKKILQDFGFQLIYVNVIFMDDESLLEINKEFLQHDYYTDIITFNYAERPKDIEAELYISVERVKENAEKLSISWLIELYRVLIHGVLHLVGYKDETKALKEAMQAVEDKYLKLI